jgi:acetolactate synthase-1/2/3 large subunit
MRLNGAQLVVALLEQQGITTLSGIPGGAILPLYDALSQSSRIRHVLARHEQGAGFIAQGMARATGRPGVCLASSGPGVTNLLTAVADAMLDSIPLVVITGQVPRAMLGTDAFQEVDTHGLSMPITKHNFLVGSAQELLEVIPRAFAIASQGRPGPVWIDIPKDVQTESIELTEWPAPLTTPIAPAPDPLAVARAADLINQAARPVLYLGGGTVHSPGAAPLALALAELASLPTTMTLMALGALPADHPLSLGMLGMHAARHTNLALEECDLLIAVGARFDDRATGDPKHFCTAAQVVHIDIDAAELDKIRRTEVSIGADVAITLKQLLRHIEPRTRARWRTRIAALKHRFPLLMPGCDDPRSHYGLIRAVAACAPDSAVICTDVGQHQMWVAQAYPLLRPRQWLTSGGLGTMGFGLPAAIGAALAAPQRTVICFTGDGSLLMNIQELATAAEQGVNLKIVLLNNQSLGLVQQQQSLFYGERIYASRYRTSVDFPALARGFGIAAVDLDGCAQPATSLRAALLTRGPCLIHASIEPQAKVFPMVPPGAANRAMIGGLQ